MKINDHIQIFNQNNIELMASMPDESVDIICIDPPYLYLKGQKLERPFDEELFFSECKRLLTERGFIILFGRGVSFYRWNMILDDLGFIFKEEVIWDKSYSSSPLMPLSRVHETVSIHSLGGCINKVKVPYMEMKGHDIDAIITDIKRLKTTFKKTKSLNAVLQFLENNKLISDGTKKQTSTTVSSVVESNDRCASVMRIINEGMNEKSIIRNYTDEVPLKQNVNSRHGVLERDRCEKVMQGIEFGLNEKSIIKQIRDHYSTIHPTQKPVRLIERLLALTIPKGKPREEVVVADFFAGSMSCMEATYNMLMKGIACEIDEEYFEAGKKRLENLKPAQKELFEKTHEPIN